MWNFLLHRTPLLYLTQSLWRDEAYSILVSQQPVWFILQKLSFEPPLPYLALHVWMKFFGSSEISTRLLQFLVFCGASVVVIFWSEKLYKNHWLSWFLPVFFFLNPMLLYYAFEIRSYSWYMLFTVLSLYAYTQKRWLLFSVSNILGLYSHTYMAFVPLVETIHWALTRYRNRNQFRYLFKDPLFKSLAITSVFFAPWAIKMAGDLPKFKNSWYFPVDIQLIKSALGNMFIGYEGTPWYGWQYTSKLSAVIGAVMLLAIIRRSTRTRNLLFVLLTIIPLTVVIGISFLKPLFVNRYLLPATIGEIFICVMALQNIRHRASQALAGLAMLGFVVYINLWFPAQHPKPDTRKMIRELSAIQKSDDVIYVESPLNFFEAVYYARRPESVFLYNPTNHPFPWYVGDIVIRPEQMRATFPPYPQRTIFLNKNLSYKIIYEQPKPLP